MPNKHGDFICYGLMSNDVETAPKYYGAVTLALIGARIAT